MLAGRLLGNWGAMYHGGNGVSQDYIEALKWIKPAAEGKVATAQRILGPCIAADMNFALLNA